MTDTNTNVDAAKEIDAEILDQVVGGATVSDADLRRKQEQEDKLSAAKG